MVENDNQDTSINIEEIYRNIIQEIDKYRSNVSVYNNIGLINSFINSLGQNGANKDPDIFLKNIVMDTKPQESRCHAFYRLLGLPVIGPSNLLYSPGYDVDNISNTEVINNKYKVIQDIKNNKPDLFKVMDARENNVNLFSQIFSLSNLFTKTSNINASVLALSSVGGGQIRTFGSFLNDSADPFDTVIKNQSYSAIDKNSINTYNLSDYKDASGSSPTLLSSKLFNESLLKRRGHFLKPFMVDPRIDLTINPPTSLVCAPFVLDASKTVYVKDNITLERPFIEYVCRSRFNKNNIKLNDPGIPERYKNWQDYIKNSNKITDQSLINKLSSGITQTVEAFIFLKNFNIMRAMIRILKDSINTIKEVQTKYHWIPIPDNKGIDHAVYTQSIVLQSVIINGIKTAQLDPMSTQNDREIIDYTAKIELSNVNSNNVKQDLGNFAFQNIQALPDSSVSPGFINRAEDTLKSLLDERTEITNKACNALKYIEIIMGEFSGLGLCDIIAIYTALWTIDSEVLVNMLDDESFNRMIKDPSLLDIAVVKRQNNGGRTLSGEIVLNKFESKIKEILNLMDDIFKNYTDNNQQ